MTSFRRWFIRSCFIMPLLLCVVGLAWSMTRWSVVRYSHVDYAVGCDSLGGNVVLTWLVSSATTGSSPVGWEYKTFSLPAKILWDWSNNLGFNFETIKTPHEEGWQVDIPYWFLILLFSFALLYVWRKTRPKPSPNTAFPVEVKG